jgi:uncharacterized membrane protein YraQ (UPF0718 family)
MILNQEDKKALKRILSDSWVILKNIWYWFIVGFAVLAILNMII